MGDISRFPSAAELRVIAALKSMDDDLFENFCIVTGQSEGFFYFHPGNSSEETIVITEQHNHLIKRELEKRHGK